VNDTLVVVAIWAVIVQVIALLRIMLAGQH
jgi:hypothetical protein